MNRTLNIITLLVLSLIVPLSGSVQAAPGSRPNIIFLFADDLGVGDLHCYGHPYSRTPNIDRLASQGTRFTQFYATGCTCCPSRTGFMTSKWPASYPTYPADGGFANQVTVTELLKKAGYHTGHFGKWHIGPEHSSGTYGMDAIGGEEEGGKKKKSDDRGRDAHIYDDAIRFIEANKNQPFYVNVWGHISHNPVDPTDGLVKRWATLKVSESDFPKQMSEKFSDARNAGGDVDDGMRRYLADVESLDDSVGRLLQRLQELGLSDKTIVVFSSDQGADMGKTGNGGLRFNMMGCNGPHRGGKHTNFEGGVRIPFIVRWPSHVPVGRVDETSVLSAVDWLPTLCSITGTKINTANFEGEDASAAWLGKGKYVRTKPLYWKTSATGSECVIRDGQWKLFHPTRKKAGEIELYNILTDPAESNNIAAQHPDIVKKLSAKVDGWVAALPKEYVKSKDKQD